MACGCKKPKVTVVLETLPEPIYYVVQCTNCNSPLVTEQGVRMPINIVPLRVSENDLNYWKSQGYTFEVTPL